MDTGPVFKNKWAFCQGLPEMRAAYQENQRRLERKNRAEEREREEEKNCQHPKKSRYNTHRGTFCGICHRDLWDLLNPIAL